QAKYPNGLPVWGPTLAPLAGGQTYTHPSGLFSVNVPSSWAPIQSDDASVLLGIPTPPTGCAATVMDAPTAGGLIALDGIVSQLNQQLTGYTEVSKDKVVIGGKPAYRRIVNFTEQGVSLQGEQVYFVNGPLAGAVLCSTVPGN